MTESPAHEARQMTRLLTQQRDLYRQLRELARGQSAAIEQDQSEALLRVLAQRQRLITELSDVNIELEPYRSRWANLRESLDAAERIRTAELVEEVQNLLGEILQQDQADSEALERKSSGARQQAAAASVGRQVNAAYAAQRYGATARLIDRQDDGGGSA